MFIKKGTTSKIIQFMIEDSTNPGFGLTGLVYNSPGLKAYYYLEGDWTSYEITLVNMITVGAYASGGFKEIDSANMPGLYQLSLPNAAIATANSVTIMLLGAVNMLPVRFEIQLVNFNPLDSIRLGLTAIPNASIGAAGQLATGDANGFVTLRAITHSGATIPTVTDVVNDVGIMQSGADKVWVSNTVNGRKLTSASGLVLNKGTEILGFNDLSNAQIQTDVAAVLDTPIVLAPTSQSLSERIYTLSNDLTTTRAEYLDELGPLNIPSDIDSLTTQIGVAGDGLTNLGDIRIDNLDAPVSSAIQITDIPTIVDQVWDEVLTSHVTPDSAGLALGALSMPSLIEAIINGINDEGVIVKGFSSAVVTDIDPDATTKLVRQTFDFVSMSTLGNYLYSIARKEDGKYLITNIVTPYGPYNVGQELPESVQQDMESSLQIVKTNFLDPGLIE